MGGIIIHVPFLAKLGTGACQDTILLSMRREYDEKLGGSGRVHLGVWRSSSFLQQSK